MYHYVLSSKRVQVVCSNTRLYNLLNLVQNLPGELTRFPDLDDLHRTPDHRCPRYQSLVRFTTEGVVWLADVRRQRPDRLDGGLPVVAGDGRHQGELHLRRFGPGPEPGHVMEIGH